MNYERSEGGILMPSDSLKLGGRFHVEHIRAGELIDEFEFPNLVVNEGLDHVLNTVFHGGGQVGTWYIGLFEGNYTPVPTVTAATITAAATETTAYDEAQRQPFDEAASSAQSITNSASKATFTMNATKTIYGAFLISNATKSATSGTLFSAARFTTAKAVAASDQLLVSYTFNASSV
jgi:hypothetical protein